MALSLPLYSATSVEYVRANASLLEGATTVNFGPSGNDIYFKIQSPLIGETLALLPDASIIKWGATIQGQSGEIQDVSVLMDIQILQVKELSYFNPQTNKSEKELVFQSIGSSQTLSDEVLTGAYPDIANRSQWLKLLVGPGLSDDRALPEFFIRVRGKAKDVSVWEDVYGVDLPNEGRALLTRGSVSGERDLAWGKWLDVQSKGATTPDPDVSLPNEPKEPPLSPTEIAAASQGATAVITQDGMNTNKINVLRAILTDTQMKIALQKQALESYTAEQRGLYVSQVLETAAIAGELAQTALTFLPTVRLGRLLNAAATGVEVASQGQIAYEFGKSAGAFVKEPSLSTGIELYNNGVSFGISFGVIKAKLENYLNAAQLVKSTVSYVERVQKNNTDLSIAKSNIARVEKSLSELYAKEAALKAEIAAQQTVDVRLKDVGGVLRDESNGGGVSVVYSPEITVVVQKKVNTNPLPSADAQPLLNEAVPAPSTINISIGATETFVLAADRQKISIVSGDIYVEGAASQMDSIVLSFNAEDVELFDAGNGWVTIYAPSVSVVAHEVSSVVMKNATYDVGLGKFLGGDPLLKVMQNNVDSTTGVVAMSYQFFEGAAPVRGGFGYLLNSAINSADLNDPYYTGFNQENRYINFASNLGVFGSKAGAFKSKFESLSFSEAIYAIYDEIVGFEYAFAKGDTKESATKFFMQGKGYYEAVAQQRVMPGAPNLTLDMATKIVAVGSVMNEAIKANLGRYSEALDGFMLAVDAGDPLFGVNVLGAYLPKPDVVPFL